MANFIEQIRRPMLRRLHAYWDERRGAREFPGRPDIDPIDMHFALGHISLIDVLHEPLRFRYRLHGSIVAAWVGMDMTGKFVDEIPERERRGFSEDDFRAVVAARQPLARRGGENRDEGHWNFDSIILPLGLADGEINMLLLCVDYHTD
jgi:hypothetical protein